MTDDPLLLRRYADEHSQEAFAALVQRHLPWVYRTALRRTGGRKDLAEDVAQYVFIALARQAGPLAGREQLAGWFYVTIRNAAAQLVRAEARRRIYESNAAVMSELDDSSPQDGGKLRAVLDQEMDRLSAKDREALILRFFENKSFHDIGQRLQLGEDGARKRVERALDRLGSQFSRRGLVSSVAAVTGLLTAEGAVTVSAQLQALVTQVAVSDLAPSSGVAALIKLMSATKTSMTGLVLTGLAGLVALSTATLAVHELVALRSERAAAAAAAQRTQAEQDRLRAAERDATTAAAKLAAFQQEVAKKRTAAAQAVADARSASAKAAAARAQKAQADTHDFFAQYSQARPELLQYFLVHAAAGNALYLRQAGLSAAQTNALLNAIANYQADAVLVHPGTNYPSTQAGLLLPDSQAQAILGDQFPAFKASENTEAGLGWAGALARSAAEGGVPLSLDQAAALTQIVASNSPEYTSGGAINPAHVNWDTVVAQAQQTMTPAQWAQVQPTLEMQAIGRQIAAAAAAGNSP